MPDYISTLELAADVDPDRALDRLRTHTAYLATAGETSAAVVLTLRADTLEEASVRTLDAVRALPQDVTVLAIQVAGPDAAGGPATAWRLPEMVNHAEIARMANVTRQRAQQLPATYPDFPVPLQTINGLLYPRAAVQKWLDARGREPRAAATS